MLIPITSLFQVRCISALLPLLLLRTMVDSSQLTVIKGFSILNNPLDKILQTLFLSRILLSIFELIDVLCFTDVGCPERNMWFMMIYKLCFYTVGIRGFFKRNSTEILVRFSIFKKL